MATRPELLEKWAPILEHSALPKISDQYRKEVTAVLLENQEAAMRESASAGNLFEADSIANVGGAGLALGGAGTNANMAGYDPVLISLVRRSVPQNIAFDICGVQPMTQPTGLIFAMKSRYAAQNGTEALFYEADTAYSGRLSTDATGTNALFDGSTDGTGTTGIAQSVLQNALSGTAESGNTGTGMSTATGETNDAWTEMAFSIEKTSVIAKTRMLKAEYSEELAQDLKAVHGLDAAAELSNILSQEITAEINREIIRKVYISAVKGAKVGTAVEGVFDLDVDSNGRWSVEKFKGLMFQIEREANAIGQQTRRGRGNFIITSADVASALAMAGVLDYSSGISGQNNLNVDDTSTTFAGVLNGKYKVYVDPYAQNVNATQFFIVGYKGASAFDAGIFYCPYQPLQMVRATDPSSFQPKIGFRSRYGIVANPFASNTNNVATDGLFINSNVYYRKVLVSNLM
jgi:hypothetical protein